MRLLVKNIGTIVGIETAGRLRLCGGEMDRLETFDDAWLLSDNGRIAAFGSMNSLGEMAADEVVDAGGGMLLRSADLLAVSLRASRRLARQSVSSSPGPLRAAGPTGRFGDFSVPQAELLLVTSALFAAQFALSLIHI